MLRRVLLSAAVEIFLNTERLGPTLIPGALSLFFASFWVAAAAGRVRSGRIILSPRGIEQHGWSFRSSSNWTSIVGVEPSSLDRPVLLVVAYANAEWERCHTTRIWRIDRLPRVPVIEIDCHKFDVDPEALYRYLAYYVDHPEGRWELGTDAALRRARDNDVPRPG